MIPREHVQLVAGPPFRQIAYSLPFSKSACGFLSFCYRGADERLVEVHWHTRRSIDLCALDSKADSKDRRESRLAGGNKDIL